MRQARRLPMDHQQRAAIALIVGYGHRTVRIDLRSLASDDIKALDEVMAHLSEKVRGHTTLRIRNALDKKRCVTREFLSLGVVDRLALIAT